MIFSVLLFVIHYWNDTDNQTNIIVNVFFSFFFFSSEEYNWWREYSDDEIIRQLGERNNANLFDHNFSFWKLSDMEYSKISYGFSKSSIWEKRRWFLSYRIVCIFTFRDKMYWFHRLTKGWLNVFKQSFQMIN
jgi:hypothetical protein